MDTPIDITFTLSEGQAKQVALRVLWARLTGSNQTADAAFVEHGVLYLRHSQGQYLRPASAADLTWFSAIARLNDLAPDTYFDGRTLTRP